MSRKQLSGLGGTPWTEGKGVVVEKCDAESLTSPHAHRFAMGVPPFDYDNCFQIIANVAQTVGCGVNVPVHVRSFASDSKPGPAAARIRRMYR